MDDGHDLNPHGAGARSVEAVLWKQIGREAGQNPHREAG
jgi:hypothetical protein